MDPVSPQPSPEPITSPNTTISPKLLGIGAIVILLLIAGGAYAYLHAPSAAPIKTADTATSSPEEYVSITVGGDNCIGFSDLPTSKRDDYSNINGVLYNWNDPVQPAPDLATWQSCYSSDSASYSVFAKDKDHVWLNGILFPDADPSTFALIGYRHTYSIPANYTKTGVASSTTETNFDYQKDATHVWHLQQGSPGRVLMPGADPATFKELRYADIGDIAEDKNHVYLNAQILPDAVPATFSVISVPWGEYSTVVYLKDSIHAWLAFGKLNEPPVLIPGAGGATFAYLGDRYSCEQGPGCPEQFIAKDANHVYLNDQIIPDVDVASYTFLSAAFEKDKYHVYYFGKILEGTDPATFESVEGNWGLPYDYFGKDANHVYHGKQILEGADPVTFMVLTQPDGSGTGYEKDVNYAYYGFGDVIAGADPASLELVPQVTSTTTNKNGKQKVSTDYAEINSHNVDAKDTDHYYFQGKLVQ